MNKSLTPTTQVATWMRPLVLIALFALAAILTLVSTLELEKAVTLLATPAMVGRLRLENREGILYRRGVSSPFSGWVTDRFSDGTLKLRSAVEDGLLHGESEGWFTNGAPELREYFHRGIPHGTRTTWHENGQKRSEGQIVDGRQEGLYRQWHANGRLAVEAEFAHGKPNGLSHSWHPDGSLKAEAEMKYGEIKSRHVYPEGTHWEPTLLAGNPIP